VDRRADLVSQPTCNSPHLIMNDPEHEQGGDPREADGLRSSTNTAASPPDEEINRTDGHAPSRVRYSRNIALAILVAGALMATFIALVRYPDQRFAVVISVSGLIAGLIVWLVPKWQVVKLRSLSPGDLFEQENEARRTISQIVGGIIILAGLYYTSENLKTAQRAASQAETSAAESRDLTREGQITDRFTKAIGQLGETGKDKTSVRLGGIYALERISRESEGDHIPIMEILVSYVTEHAPENLEVIDLNAAIDCSKVSFRPGIDAPSDEIQAILTVISRRPTERVQHERDSSFTMELAGANLRRSNARHANLEQANLNATEFEGANLADTDLRGANLFHAYFQGADLENAVFDNTYISRAFFDIWHDKYAQCQGARTRTYLMNASFKGATFNGADFSNAYLMRAKFDGAKLDYVDFDHADLSGASFKGADLTRAVNITQAQIDAACLDDKTKLPPLLSFDSWRHAGGSGRCD